MCFPVLPEIELFFVPSAATLKEGGREGSGKNCSIQQRRADKRQMIDVANKAGCFTSLQMCDFKPSAANYQHSSSQPAGGGYRLPTETLFLQKKKETTLN